jgi:hypothetical protein
MLKMSPFCSQTDFKSVEKIGISFTSLAWTDVIV